MRRKVILFGGLFFLVLLFTMGTLVGVAQAEENPCFYIKECLVPAPTIVVPEFDSSTHADSLVITGLSWNETLVDVYVDGVYNGRAKLNLDDSGVANFVYRTFLPLVPGEHSIYTVARNLNERERSIESSKIRFFVMARPLVTFRESEKIAVNIEDVEKKSIVDDVLKTDDIKSSVSDIDIQSGQLTDGEEKEIVGVITKEEVANISIAPEAEGKIDVNEGQFVDEERGQIEGGVWEQIEAEVSNLQKTIDRDQIIDEFFSDDAEIFTEQRNVREKRNRQIGFAMLGVIIVISIVWVIVSSHGLSADVEQIGGKSGGGKKSLAREELEPIESVFENEKTEDIMDDELDRLV